MNAEQCVSKIALYLSDISGAFDKVFKDFLLAKLYRAGVGDAFLDFLNAYLSPRIGYVTIEGAMSEAFEIADSVFQGTVLGPTLWNTFVADVAFSATQHGGQEELFADDLNIFHEFDKNVPEATVQLHVD